MEEQDKCPFCGRMCQTPVSASMPREVVEAYKRAKRGTMRTCEFGAADDYRKLGASYADVIAARLQSLHRHTSD
jgi:hypothetical protein